MTVGGEAEQDTQPLARAFGVACACAGFYAAYFVSTAVPTPLLWYYPLERRFALQTHPTGLAMDFVGRVLLAIVFGALAGWFGRALGARWNHERLARNLRMVGAWSAALLLFTAAMYIYLLVGRNPFPLPLPAGYTPR